MDLFEQESEYVIDVLEDCRFELGRTAEVFLGEAEQLRAASRMLGELYVVGSSVLFNTRWKAFNCSVVCVVSHTLGNL